MKTVIISPFSKSLRSGKQNNPKNFPWWDDVIKLLKHDDIHIIQVGIEGEVKLNVDEILFNKTHDELKDLILKCDTWISVDNFFPHLCSLLHKPGVVIFGKSDPNIFGYPSNVNLLKDRKYLREKQFEIWEVETFGLDYWITPEEIYVSVLKII